MLRCKPLIQDPARYNPTSSVCFCTRGSFLWHMQGMGISGPKIQDLAVTCLADFAETSLVNCGKIAAVSGGPALAEIASAAVHDRHRSMLESQLTRLMSILAQDCPIRYPTTPAPAISDACISRSAASFVRALKHVWPSIRPNRIQLQHPGRLAIYLPDPGPSWICLRGQLFKQNNAPVESCDTQSSHPLAICPCYLNPSCVT